MGSITDEARNVSANAAMALLNGGLLNIYSGIPPTNVNTALSGNTLLARPTFANPAFSAAAAGVATVNTMGADNLAAATGSPSFARGFKSGGSVPVFQILAACAWQGNTTYNVGDYVVNGGGQYRCTTEGTSAASGGPVGTGSTIGDNDVVWAYIGFAEAVITGAGPRIVQFGSVSVSSFAYSQSGT